MCIGYMCIGYMCIGYMSIGYTCIEVVCLILVGEPMGAMEHPKAHATTEPHMLVPVMQTSAGEPARHENGPSMMISNASVMVRAANIPPTANHMWNESSHKPRQTRRSVGNTARQHAAVPGGENAQRYMGGMPRWYKPSMLKNPTKPGTSPKSKPAKSSEPLVMMRLRCCAARALSTLRMIASDSMLKELEIE